MKDSFASVNGVPATSLRLVVGQVGPWVVDAILEEDTPMEGRVLMRIGEHQLSGTISPNSGAFGLKGALRIVAGANGWGRIIPPKPYHNDAGVKTFIVASDAARECGEAFGTFAPSAERVGAHYARTEGLASNSLEDLIGEALWWVDYDGITHVGARERVDAHPSSYEVLEYNPRTRTVTLAVDDPLAIGIGSVLTERLDAPQTVREFELSITADSMRVKAWCGGNEASKGALTSAMERIVESIFARRLFGLWPYRVVSMVGDRVFLQIAQRSLGVPDLAHVSMWPGLAGGHAELPAGAEVLVAFVCGRRSRPVIVAFPGKDKDGFVPDRLDFFNGTKEVARNGDPVEVALPPATLTGTAMIGGVPTPITGAMVYTAMKATGTIKGGSGKMKIGG